MKPCLVLAVTAVPTAAWLSLAAADDGQKRPAAPPSLEGQNSPTVPAPFAGQDRAGAAAPVTAPKRRPEPQPIELSGRLHRPPKWSPQLELIPAGQIKRFDLHGDLLRDVKEGTFLRVRGVVRSWLHRGGTRENPSPFPPQWTVQLEVTEVEVLADPLDVLKRGPGE